VFRDVKTLCEMEGLFAGFDAILEKEGIDDYEKNSMNHQAMIQDVQVPIPHHTLSDEEIKHMRNSMFAHGGAFAKALEAAYGYADSENRATLYTAFYGIFSKYLDW